MAHTLLLADDSPTIAKILQMALSQEGYEIRAVLTAEDAIRELKAQPPSIFLCDLSLPAKNGYEFARLIRADSKLRDVRVVLLASAFEPVDEGEYATCGADQLVKKPFDPSDLRTKLRMVLESPPKFPAGSHVTGSLSGFMVADHHESTKTNLTIGGMSASNTHDTNPDVLKGKPAPAADPLANLLAPAEAPPAGKSADDILASLLGGGDVPPPETPPPFPAAPASASPDEGFRPDKTVAIDLNAQDLGPSAGVLDLSGAFGGTTPPGGTSAIELGTHTVNFAAPPAEEPPPAPPAAAAAPKPAAPAADEPLSANAQALAAFFDAEIQAKASVPPAAPPGAKPAEAPPDSPPAEPADAFDASLDSIDWGKGPGDDSLSQWSSTAKPASEPPRSALPQVPGDKPPPFGAPKVARSTTTPGFAPAPAPAPGLGAAPGGDSAALLFDIGESTFRFSEDYITRITKSFTGNPEETVPEKHAMFHQQSDDRGPVAPPVAPEAPVGSAPATGPGGGAWSETDVQMIEKIVREEVQMVVREVAEKIAWEVIPELAENLIRKELEKVLKEMGQ